MNKATAQEQSLEAAGCQKSRLADKLNAYIIPFLQLSDTALINICTSGLGSNIDVMLRIHFQELTARQHAELHILVPRGLLSIQASTICTLVSWCMHLPTAPIGLKKPATQVSRASLGFAALQRPFPCTCEARARRRTPFLPSLTPKAVPLLWFCFSTSLAWRHLPMSSIRDFVQVSDA